MMKEVYSLRKYAIVVLNDRHPPQKKYLFILFLFPNHDFQIARSLHLTKSYVFLALKKPNGCKIIPNISVGIDFEHMNLFS